MLDTNIEFNKGILFVRLSGRINNKNEKNVKDKVLTILKEGGIKNLVFNVENLNMENDITLFMECNKIIKLNNGKMILCTSNNLNINYIEKANDELAALRMINIC